MFEENLSKLGFSPSEIKIYLHVYKTGCSYANKISSETKINRTNVYEALDRLISKGVVSFITKNNMKWFEAKSPEAIVSLINEKEEELKATKNTLISEITQIKLIKIKKQNLEANIFTGKKGLRMIFEEILDAKTPISLIASKLQFQEVFGPYFELWHKQRIEKRITQRSIFPLQLKGKIEKRELLGYKFVESNFTNPTTTILYGDNCLFVEWSEEPIAIKIHNKEIAKSHLNYFEILWKQAKS